MSNNFLVSRLFKHENNKLFVSNGILRIEQLINITESVEYILTFEEYDPIINSGKFLFFQRNRDNGSINIRWPNINPFPILALFNDGDIFVNLETNHPLISSDTKFMYKDIPFLFQYNIILSNPDIGNMSFLYGGVLVLLIIMLIVFHILRTK